MPQRSPCTSHNTGYMGGAEAPPVSRDIAGLHGGTSDVSEPSFLPVLQYGVDMSCGTHRRLSSAPVLICCTLLEEDSLSF